jgi:hypothetical protein
LHHSQLFPASIATTDTPFRIERDEDVSALFAFLGQVRDRFLYHVSDIKEQHVPAILNWILKQCDLNKDIEIDSTAQLTFPDIQLKSADRVFRLYVKVMRQIILQRRRISYIKPSTA